MLTSPQQSAVLKLVATVKAADTASPLNEAAILTVEMPGVRAAQHWLVPSEPDNPTQPAEAFALAGYAQLNPTDGSVQLLVHPHARRHGIGSALAHAAATAGATNYWAFGDLAAAQRLADRLSMHAVRRLLFMARPAQLTTDRPPDWPTGVSLGSYQASDLDAIVRLNHAAFAHHPEQGAMTSDDALQRMSQPWFKPQDLLLAKDQGGSILGFHWTKITTTPDTKQGEVYILAVAPQAAHRGVGRALLRAGIVHMQHRGATSIDLYVEADQPRVVHMYEKAGFTVRNTDASYQFMER